MDDYTTEGLEYLNQMFPDSEEIQDELELRQEEEAYEEFKRMRAEHIWGTI